MSEMVNTTQYLIVGHLTRKTIARIFRNIIINKESGCWEWIGSSIQGGYGRVSYLGRTESVYRLLYAWLVEPLQRGNSNGILELDHIKCNNIRCANPSHVKLVTHQANVLRSVSPTSVNANKTHCVRGHLLPVERNDRHAKKRYCKTCSVEVSRSRRANYIANGLCARCGGTKQDDELSCIVCRTKCSDYARNKHRESLASI